MVQGTINIAVKTAITKTCLHLLPRSDSHNARIGNGVTNAGLTRAATPQVAPHTLQSATLVEEVNLMVSKRASPPTRADKAVSHRMYGKIATYGDNAHIQPANTPACSL